MERTREPQWKLPRNAHGDVRKGRLGSSERFDRTGEGADAAATAAIGTRAAIGSDVTNGSLRSSNVSRTDSADLHIINAVLHGGTMPWI